MRKVIGFELPKSIDLSLLQDLCKEIFSEVELDNYSDSIVTLIVKEDEIFLLKTLKSHFEDNGVSLTGVISHTDGEILIKALQFAKTATSNQVIHLADVILLEAIHKKNAIIKEIDSSLKHVSFEAIATARAFIEHGCNALAAAESLYIHRNTFSYRLNKFIDQTDLDIRDFHNARLFQNYLILQHYI